MKFSKSSSIRYTESIILGAGIGMQEDSSGRIELFSSGTGGGGATVLNDLNDVVISAPGSGEYLRYNGSEWVNDNIVAGDLPSHTHPASQITAGTFDAGNFEFQDNLVVNGDPGGSETVRVTGGLRLGGAASVGMVAAATTVTGFFTAENDYFNIGTIGLDDIFFTTNQAIRWAIGSTGNLLTFVDGSPSIGLSGNNRPHWAYIASGITVGQSSSIGLGTFFQVGGPWAAGGNAVWVSSGRLDHAYYNSFAPLDAKRWDWSVDGVGGVRSIALYTRYDNGTAGNPIISAVRDGARLTQISIGVSSGNITIGNPTATVTITGDNTYVTGPLAVGATSAYPVTPTEDEIIVYDGTRQAGFLVNSTQAFIGTRSNHDLEFFTNNTGRWEILSIGDFVPITNNTYDIGSNSLRPKDIYSAGDLYLGTIGKFEGTPTGTLRTDDLWSYNGTNWTNRLLQVTFASGDVVAGVQADNTRTSYVNTVSSPAGTPTAPTSGQDIVLTPVYKGMIVDVSAYGALPANQQFVAEYSINSGSSFTALPPFTGNRIVHSNLNLPWGYRYRYKVRGATDSTYSDETADTLPSSVAETNAFGLIVASQISTANLSAITADIGEVITGKLRNIANDRGILLGGSLPGSWTTYLNLEATGVNPILHHPSFDLKADGTASFSGTVTAGSFHAGTAIIDFSIISPFFLTSSDVENRLDMRSNSLTHLAGFPRQADINFAGNQVRIGTDPNGLSFSAQGATLLASGVHVGVGATVQYKSLTVGNIGGAKTINWNENSIQRVVLVSGTTTLSFTAPELVDTATSRSVILTLYVKQDGSGSRTVTWPGTVIWPSNGVTPTLTTTANRTDIFTFLYDSSLTKYIGSVTGQNYSGL